MALTARSGDLPPSFSYRLPELAGRHGSGGHHRRQVMSEGGSASPTYPMAEHVRGGTKMVQTSVMQNHDKEELNEYHLGLAMPPGGRCSV
jgi:hypothetical protein